MDLFKSLIFCLILIIAGQLKANNTSNFKTTDSLTLAQAYVNLTLTEEYFDTLGVERISNIIQFEESELNSIIDSGFIKTNAYLYNFSFALLYFNKAKFEYKNESNPNREILLHWKNTLETAIQYFNRAELNNYFYHSYAENNNFNEFIGFSDRRCQNLKEEIIELKRKFNPYFNRNIYPDFQRIFLEAKQTGHFNFDSLAYYTTLFNLPLNRNIFDNTSHGKTVNKSEGSWLSNINTEFNLEVSLDLISRYLQLKMLASGNSQAKILVKNAPTLYVQYSYFVKDLNLDDSNVFGDSTGINQIQKDNFFQSELNPEVCNLLFEQLKEKYLSGLITTTKAYFNLLNNQRNFDSLSTEQIEKNLSFEEKELQSINDSVYFKNYNYLYNQAFSVLYLGYAKLLFANKTNPEREILLQWKNTLEKSINHFNLSELDSVFPPDSDKKLFFDLIGFTEKDCKTLQNDIIKLKSEFNPYFNRDIYPDFQRIFYVEKKSGKFSFGALWYYTALYNLPLSRDILDNQPYGRTINQIDHTYYNWNIKTNYKLDLALDLISRYLQLKKVLKTNKSDESICDINWACYNAFIEDLNPDDKTQFGIENASNQIFKDDFFRRELDAATCEKLRRQLIKKCGNIRYPAGILDYDNDGVPDYNVTKLAKPMSERYYFPVPAPFPSSYLFLNDYKPSLVTMKQVDDYFTNIFNKKGYAGQLHYYYVESGFALTTSLEKINSDGSPVSGNTRWSVSIGGNGSLSLYETFKSIFFATESNFRIIGLIISPKAATLQKSPSAFGGIQDLLIYSYTSLPGDIKDFSLTKKTLTILIYNYYQSDIGKVPMLDVSKRLSVKDHLEKSGLQELMNAR